MRSNPFEKFHSLKKNNVSDIESLRLRFENLLEADISDEEAVKSFIEKRDIIDGELTTAWGESYFLMTTEVSDEQKKQQFEHINQKVIPLSEEYSEKLDQKLLNSDVAQSLPAPYPLLMRNLKSEVELFSAKNIDLIPIRFEISVLDPSLFKS